MTKLKNLARLRRSRGLSQRDVAELVGVTPGCVAQWEKGAMPNFEHLAALTSAFRVTTEYLMGFQGTRPTDGQVGNVIELRKVA